MAVPPLAKVQQEFTKKFGDHAMTTASDLKALAHMSYGVSSQCLSLDLAIGRPGFPAGRLTEVFGHTNQGKSTLSYSVLAECQRVGGMGVLLETELAYEPPRLQALGVNTDDLWLLQPQNMEQVFGMIELAIQRIRVTYKFKGPVVMVVDTIAGMKSAVEQEGGFDEQHVGTTARVVAQALRKIVWPVAEHKIVLIFLNQLSHSFARYGEQFVTYGGTQIHKSSSLRVRLTSRQSDLVKKGSKTVGSWTLAWCQKNKLAMPFQSTKYLLMFDHGIDLMEDLWQVSERLGVVKLKQKQYTFALNGKSAPIERSKWETFVMEKFKSPANLRERLTKVAIEQQLLRPYGEKQ